jgi:hypothetical protein
MMEDGPGAAPPQTLSPTTGVTLGEGTGDRIRRWVSGSAREMSEG